LLTATIQVDAGGLRLHGGRVGVHVVAPANYDSSKLSEKFVVRGTIESLNRLLLHSLKYTPEGGAAPGDSAELTFAVDDENNGSARETIPIAITSASASIVPTLYVASELTGNSLEQSEEDAPISLARLSLVSTDPTSHNNVAVNLKIKSSRTYFVIDENDASTENLILTPSAPQLIVGGPTSLTLRGLPAGEWANRF